MPDAPTTPDTETPPAPAPDAETPAPEVTPEGQEPPTDTPDAGTEGDEGDDGQTFDATYVRGLRAEAADWRTKFRDLEGKYANAKTPEEVAEVTSQLQAENARLERELLVGRVAAKHSLPDELASLLKGDDEKALTEHAKTLAKYVTSNTDPDLGGGLNPLDDDGPSDPRTLAARHGRRR